MWIDTHTQSMEKEHKYIQINSGTFLRKGIETKTFMLLPSLIISSESLPSLLYVYGF